MTDESVPVPQTLAASESKPATFDAGAFDRFMDRVAPKLSAGGGGNPMRRREATVTVSHQLCELNLFDEDFQVTVRSLNSADELTAMKQAGSDSAAAHVMAKLSVHKMNGRILKAHEVDMLWEALGFSGRVVVANAFLQHCTGADEELLGKSLSSVEVG